MKAYIKRLAALEEKNEDASLKESLRSIGDYFAGKSPRPEDKDIPPRARELFAISSRLMGLA